MPIAAEQTPIFFRSKKPHHPPTFFRSKEPPPIFFRSKKPHHPPIFFRSKEPPPIFFRSKKSHHPPLPMPIAAEKTQPDATDGGLRSTLSPEQLRSFHTNGYLVIESFSEEGEIEEMMGRMRHLLEGFDSSASSSIFSAKNQQKFTDNFFFESAENISFFFEEGAFGSDGRLKHPKELSINKVGHALHELDPIFKKFSQSSKMSGLLFSLGYERPLIIQSMYIFKQPGIGGEVVPHQDNSFLYTDPPSCTGLWLALEDAMVSNGCLWALPGSHKNGLVRRFLRDENGVHFDHPSPSYDRNDFIPLEVKAGSLVILHGDLIHQSFENQSSKSRHAYTVHAVDSEGCKWASDNWIRRKTEARPLYEVEPASSRDDRSR